MIDYSFYYNLYCFLILYLSNRLHFLGVYLHNKPRGMLVEQEKVCKSRALGRTNRTFFKRKWESLLYFVIKCHILNMFIELSDKPITAAERIKHEFSFTDRSHQNPRTDATKTLKSPFKAVNAIRKLREEAN